VSYVLSVIHPPIEPAAFGKAEVYTELPTLYRVAVEAYDVLREWASDQEYPPSDLVLSHFVEDLSRTPLGQTYEHKGWGIAMRRDAADQAPHPCPCCGRLVLPTDHAYAHLDDAFCLGCFTWSRSMTACLPANTAHTEEP
jgi:hypothetical protein